MTKNAKERESTYSVIGFMLPITRILLRHVERARSSLESKPWKVENRWVSKIKQRIQWWWFKCIYIIIGSSPNHEHQYHPILFNHIKPYINLCMDSKNNVNIYNKMPFLRRLEIPMQELYQRSWTFWNDDNFLFPTLR